MPRILLLALAALAAAPAVQAAQFAPLTIPRGQIALEIRSSFASWDRRFLDGRSQPLGTDFSRAMLGSEFFPALVGAEERLARISGLPAGMLTLGSHSARQVVTVGEGGLGLSVGITGRLTLFGSVPFRQVRVRTTTAFDSTGSLSGFNPADPTFGTPVGAGAALAFFGEFDQAIDGLTTRIANGTWNNDPATLAQAQATLAEAQALRADLFALLLEAATRSPFLPIGTSPVGMALTGRITALQNRFSSSFGVTGFSRQPPLASSQLAPADFEQFLIAPGGPVAGLLSAPALTYLGDIELGAGWLLVDQKPDSGGGWRVRTALQGTVRLRTSQLDSPDRFYDLGTGDRQPDVEGSVVTDLARGRAALRLAAWYNLQLPGNQVRRLGPPGQPIQYANTLAAVRRNPGDVVGIAVLPAYRLTPKFAVMTGVEWWTRGADAYTYADGQPPLDGLEPAILAVESAASAVTWRAGLSWSDPGGTSLGAGMPLDASVTWDRVVAAGGGRVPRAESVRAMLRLYGRLW